ncbi:hypothetical protein WR25_09250 [Diploscapter pachys]|uniref:DUF4440 domain-containing protein n=1 Tax=Diploscapter pachys TaxID=2018661 RepID=A0A2A2M0I5_9BILA|nr:hypothetical protein WR25_09250 [Diploscapter pachys]
MSLTPKEAEQILTPYVEKYCEVINNGEFHKIGPEFYDENAAMIEKSKNCVWGQKDIGEELKKLATEFGHTKFTAGILKGHYLQIWRKVGDKYVIYHDEFEML